MRHRNITNNTNITHLQMSLPIDHPVKSQLQYVCAIFAFPQPCLIFSYTIKQSKLRAVYALYFPPHTTLTVTVCLCNPVILTPQSQLQAVPALSSSSHHCHRLSWFVLYPPLHIVTTVTGCLVLHTG